MKNPQGSLRIFQILAKIRKDLAQILEGLCKYLEDLCRNFVNPLRTHARFPAVMGVRLSSFQLRLDHWSVALVRDVTSGFYANYHARRKMAEFVVPQIISPVSEDMFYVGMFWIVQGKA